MFACNWNQHVDEVREGLAVWRTGIAGAVLGGCPVNDHFDGAFAAITLR